VHPLVAILRAAAAGDTPPPDGVVEVLPAPPGPVDAVLGFTNHLVVASSVDAREVVQQLDSRDPSSWMAARFLFWLAERLRTQTGSHDLVLCAPGMRDEVDLELREVGAELADHPRVRRAARHRTDLLVFTDPDELCVLVLGRGLAGRWELAIEVEAGGRNRGLGRRMALAARTLIPEGEAVFAQVAPGNAASVRAVLAAGFHPIGSEVLFPRAR